MNNLSNKFNRFLIIVFTIAPFVAFITETYLDMSFIRIMQTLTFLGVFLTIIFKKKGFPLIFPTYLLFYLFFIIYIFYSTFILLDREFKVEFLFSNQLIGAFNIMLIIENLTLSKKHYNLLIKISKIILLIAFFVILIQQVINPNFFIKTNILDEALVSSGTENRLNSIYSWVGDLTIGFGFVPIFILIIEDFDRKNKKIMLWLLFGIIFAILTKSRWVMLNSLLVFVIIFINHKYKIKQFLRYIFIFPLVLFFSFFTLDSIGVDVTGIIKDRIFESDKKDFNNKSASTRILAFQAFNKFYWENPILGKGSIKYGMGGTGKQDYKLKSFLKGRSSQMHVGYLSLLYMYGLVGAIFFLSFLYLLLKRLLKNARKTRIWAPFLGMLGFALANLTLVTFSIFEMGLILVLVVDKYYREKRYINNGIYT